MKKIFTLLMIVLSAASAWAQSPEKMSYQAVIRNSSDQLVANQMIGMQITILQGSATGTTVYMETQTRETNENGLVSLEIGAGNVVNGNFSDIDWSDGPYFIRTEADPAGGTNYTITGTSQILSVPYALHSRSTEILTGNITENQITDLKDYLIEETDPHFAGWNRSTGIEISESQVTDLKDYLVEEADPLFSASPAAGIDAGDIADWHEAYSWGDHAGLYKLSSYTPSWTEITGKPSFATVATSGSYNDLVNKPTIINSQWSTNGSSIYYNTGNVGIGVSSPRYKLEINGGDYSYIKFFNNTSGTGVADGFVIGTTPTGSPVWLWNYENSNMHFATNNLNRMIILADGHIEMKKYLDINTDGTYGSLYVKGNEALWWDGTYFSWGYAAAWNYFAKRVSIGRAVDPGASYMLYVQGTAYATGSWNSSDARFKKNISKIDHALDRVMKTRGTSFEFRNDEFEDYQFAEGRQFGFIAQEVEEVFPELINTESDGYKSINYNGMIPVLLEAVKEQQETMDDLRAENNQLKDDNERLKAESHNVKTRLERLEMLISGTAERTD